MSRNKSDNLQFHEDARINRASGWSVCEGAWIPSVFEEKEEQIGAAQGESRSRVPCDVWQVSWLGDVSNHLEVNPYFKNPMSIAKRIKQLQKTRREFLEVLEKFIKKTVCDASK